MMKRYYVLFIIICLLFNAAGCSNSKEDKQAANNEITQKFEKIESLEAELEKKSENLKNTVKEAAADKNESNLDSNLCGINEKVIFSFKSQKSDKTLSICISPEKDYIIYRFGTKDKIEMEYPENKQDSWSKFLYEYYLRGGGKENEGLDLNYLSFDNGNFNYKVYEEFSAMNSSSSIGVKVVDKASKKETDIKGVNTSKTGSLIYFRNSKVKIKQMKEEEDQTENEAPPGSRNFSEIGFDLMASEVIGALKLNMLDAEVIKKLGEPEEKSEMLIWGADGLNHQTWFYNSKGIELDMVGEKGKQDVNSIRIKAPCDFKTNRGIGIGSTRAETQQKYKKEINKEEGAPDQTSIVAGTVYGGVLFHFEKDKVASIFVGAAAE